MGATLYGWFPDCVTATAATPHAVKRVIFRAMRNPTRSDIGCPQAASKEYVTLQAGLGRASPRWFVMIHTKVDKQQSFVV
jgi:hypothetical protein